MIYARDRATDWLESQVYYVRKGGSDSADGQSVKTALLTIGAAITKINAQSPGDGNRFEISIPDAGRYTEDFTMPTYTFLVAPAATIVGQITFSNFGSAVHIHESIPTALGFTSVGSSCVFKAFRIRGTDGSPCFAVTAGDMTVDIDELSAQTGITPVGFLMTGGELRGKIAVIDSTDTAYNISGAADAYLFVSKLVGSETNTSSGTVAITKAA